MKKFIIQSFVTAFMIFLFTAGHVNGQDLVFTIKLNKTSYKKGEPVTCTMMLKNISKNNLVVNNRFLVNRPAGPHDISFELIDPDLNTVTFNTKIKAAFESKDYILLAPGKTESATYLLSKRFELLKTGSYKLTAYYENKYDAPAELNMPAAWKGSLHSNSTVLNIR
jgi:hypothetical protein